jgi:hypothetical protein
MRVRNKVRVKVSRGMKREKDGVREGVEIRGGGGKSEGMSEGVSEGMSEGVSERMSEGRMKKRVLSPLAFRADPLNRVHYFLVISFYNSGLLS